MRVVDVVFRRVACLRGRCGIQRALVVRCQRVSDHAEALSEDGRISFFNLDDEGQGVAEARFQVAF